MRTAGTVPEPFPGLVIGYAYLWADEQDRGIEEGRKDRPSAIVAAVQSQDGVSKVAVMAITHVDPGPDGGVEIPSKDKSRLGLDDQRSWIVTTEANSFFWPGYDLRGISQTDSGPYAFGVLSVDLFEKTKRQFLANCRRLVDRELE